MYNNVKPMTEPIKNPVTKAEKLANLIFLSKELGMVELMEKMEYPLPSYVRTSNELKKIVSDLAMELV